MGVKDALLALLAEGPKHGYQLKQEFEAATSETWSLNIGQVYTTLGRLERDGLVELDTTTAADDDRKTYRLTSDGEQAAHDWLVTPLDRDVANRDEVALKLLVAISSGAEDPLVVISAQRQATTQALQDFTALKVKGATTAERQRDLAWELHLERLILHAQTEIRWLDAAEERIEDAALATTTAARTPGSDAITTSSSASAATAR